MHDVLPPVKNEDNTVTETPLNNSQESTSAILPPQVKPLDHLSIMRQVYEEISSTLKKEQVASISLDAALRLSGASSGYIALSRDGKMFVEEIIGNHIKSVIEALLNSQQGIVGRVIKSQIAERVMNVSNDVDYVAAQRPNTQAALIIPLNTQDSQLIGILSLETNRPERFTDDVFQLLQILAGHIAIALENAELHRQTKDQLEELRQVYHKVKRLEQLKTDMIRIAAHDLGNPLTAIKGTLDLLLDLDRDSFSDVHIRDMESMRNAANRMNRMLEDILSLERIEQIAKSEIYEPFNISDRVDRAIREYGLQATDKAIDIQVRKSNQSIIVRGDVAQIYEAIANLITNAIKYTPHGGEINILLEQIEDDVFFEVRDNGYGIPKEQQDRVFQPFFRAKTAETESIQGTGLGLHLVKNIVERHHGKMFFNSAYGQGSSFGFKLPLI